MSTMQPTREDKFSFGHWTVGWQTRDPFGDATRPAIDPVGTVERLSDLGAYGITFHDDDDLIPFGSDDTTRDLLADHSASDDFDADTAGRHGYGYVRLSQLAVERLLGAR